VLLQAVVQKGAAVAVLGGQPGKGSAPVCAGENFSYSGASETRSFLASREFRYNATIVRGINVGVIVVSGPPSSPLPINGRTCGRIARCRSMS
jgi:hypothetical protein